MRVGGGNENGGYGEEDKPLPLGGGVVVLQRRVGRAVGGGRRPTARLRWWQRKGGGGRERKRKSAEEVGGAAGRCRAVSPVRRRFKSRPKGAAAAVGMGVFRSVTTGWPSTRSRIDSETVGVISELIHNVEAVFVAM